MLCILSFKGTFWGQIGRHVQSGPFTFLFPSREKVAMQPLIAIASGDIPQSVSSPIFFKAKRLEWIYFNQVRCSPDVVLDREATERPKMDSGILVF